MDDPPSPLLDKWVIIMLVLAIAIFAGRLLLEYSLTGV